MVKHVNGRNVSHSMNVKARSQPGATTENLVNYVKLIACKKTKILVIRTRTNNLPDDKNTIKKVMLSLALLIEKIITLQKRSRSITPN